MAADNVHSAEITLNERLLAADDELPVGNNTTAATGMSASRKKLLLGLVAMVGVACIVVGAVAASGSFGRTSSSSSSSSSSGAGFSVVSEGVVQKRPVFSATVGSLAHAPAPTVEHQTAETETASLSFRHSLTTGAGLESHTHLRYTVVKQRNAHCPSNRESVVAIDCLASRLRLSFTNATAARAHAAEWVKGTILFLRHEWGCGMHVRRFVGSPQVYGRFVFVNTTNATLAAAFQHANISFFTNHSEPSGPIVLQTPTSSPVAPNRRRGFFSDLGNALFGSTTNAVTSLLGLVVTGDLNINQQPFSTQYTLPYTTYTDGNSAGGVNMGYSADLTLNTNIDLVISDYSLASFGATITANIDAFISASAEASASYQGSNNAPLTSQITLASGSIPVFGVQIPINMLVQVYGGYQASASASGSISGNATVQGTATAGFHYTSGQGVVPTGNAQLTGDVTVASPPSLLAAAASGFVSPQFALQAAYIGSLASDIVVTGQAALPSGSCNVAESVTGEVDVGSQINIEIEGISAYSSTNPVSPVWGPQTVWSDDEFICG